MHNRLDTSITWQNPHKYLSKTIMTINPPNKLTMGDEGWVFSSRWITWIINAYWTLKLALIIIRIHLCFWMPKENTRQSAEKSVVGRFVDLGTPDWHDLPTIKCHLLASSWNVKQTHFFPPRRPQPSPH